MYRDYARESRRLIVEDRAIARLQYAREKISPQDNFTAQGGVAVISNALIRTGITVRECQREMLKPASEGEADAGSCSAWAVNGFLVSAATSLQNDLDRIASFCQFQEPSDDVDTNSVYFRSYTFSTSNFCRISILQSKIAELRFDGKNFYDTANALKHEFPWVGQVSTGSDGFKSVRDSGGSEFLNEFVVKVYKLAVASIRILEGVYECRPTKFPSV
jgi:hypothetical protein